MNTRFVCAKKDESALLICIGSFICIQHTITSIAYRKITLLQLCDLLVQQKGVQYAIETRH